jgi:hypothetical protein
MTPELVIELVAAFNDGLSGCYVPPARFFESVFQRIVIL